MKSNIVYLIVFTVLVLNVTSVQSQTFSETTIDPIENYQLNNLASQNAATSQQAAENQRSSIIQNEVFINQTGDFNETHIRVKANNSTIDLLQNGNSNVALLDLTANDLSNKIVQNGDQNRLYNFSNNPAQNQKMNIIQNGVNQDITIFGSNSLSENLIINMQGNDRSIIVRNFD